MSIHSDDLETVGCTICGALASEALFQVCGFTIVRCAGCGVRYVSPRLKTGRLLDLYSQADYFKSGHSLTHGYYDYAAERDPIIATFQRRLEWLLSMSGKPSPGRLLDVGCALGFSIDYAISQNWDAYGLEPSRYASEIAIQRLGSRVTQGTLDTHPFQPGFFHTLLLWDVIEHVSDPLSTLKKAHALLAPGGILSVITPDCGSPLARIMGKRWMEYAKPTEHIYFFSTQTLEDLGRRAGFQKIAATTAGKFVSITFLMERLYNYASFLTFLRTGPKGRFFSKAVYLNPKDKMHLLFKKE